MTVLEHLLDRMRRQGPISFAEFLEVALYHEDGGFYAAGGRAGRQGDFITSPELGPLFAAVVARALDRWWSELGEPDPFLVVEAGAGSGTLAAGVLAAHPACAPALRYVAVERSAALRAAAAERLQLELPSFVLGPTAPRHDDDDDDDRRGVAGAGPLVTMLADLPAQPATGVTIANELLDNLPFALLERTASGWAEVRVGEDAGRLVEVSVAASPDLQGEADRLAPDAAAGGRVPVQAAAGRWVANALAAVERGRLVVFDYADTTPSLAARPWRQWLRTYRGHGPGGHPLEDPGGQDVTCEVAVDQLTLARRPHRVRPQAEFLREHGIDVLVDSARRAWSERAALGDLEAVRARSRVHEGAALTDPAGLGGFTVVEWDVT